MNSEVADLVAGFWAGSLATFVEIPFDTVKVRMQDVHAAQQYTGYRHCVTSIWKNEGFFNGFYKGLPAPLLGAALEGAVFFWAYGAAVDTYLTLKNNGSSIPERNTEPYDACVVGGVVSGAVASIHLTPIELVKCRMQLQNLLPREQWTYTNSWECAVSVARTGGIRELYTGNVAMLVREIPGCAAYFVTFQMLMRNMISANETVETAGFHKQLFAGGLAGVAFWTILFPADVVKTRAQTGSKFAGMSLWKGLTVIAKEEGLLALYRGWAVTMVRAFPVNAVYLSTYHQVHERLMRREDAQ